MGKTDTKITVRLKSLMPWRQSLRYYGSKWTLADWLNTFHPPHLCYCEPFFGGGNALFRKLPSRYEFANDINRNVVNFFYVLREQRDELIEAILLTPYARNEIDLANRTFKQDIAWLWDDEKMRFIPQGITVLELARRFYVKSRQGRTGNTSAWNSSWKVEYRGKRTRSILEDFNEIDHLVATAERLKHVHIENMPALDFIRKYDTEETLFYLDPPYLHETRGQNWTQAYAHEMSEADHIELGKTLHRLEGMAIISGYPSQLYQELFEDRGWRLETTTAVDNLNQEKTEAIWINPKAWGRLQQNKKKVKVKQAGLFA